MRKVEGRHISEQLGKAENIFDLLVGMYRYVNDFQSPSHIQIYFKEL